MFNETIPNQPVQTVAEAKKLRDHLLRTSGKETMSINIEQSIKYFNHELGEIPIMKTQRVAELGDELCDYLLGLIYERAKEQTAQQVKVDYLQEFRVTTEPQQVKIKMVQQHPYYETDHTIEIKDFNFNGRIWVLEVWNGKEKPEATINDHYILMFIPGEL